MLTRLCSISKSNIFLRVVFYVLGATLSALPLLSG